MSKETYIQLFSWDIAHPEDDVIKFLENKKPTLIEWIAPYEVYMEGQPFYKPLVYYKTKYPDTEVRVLTNDGLGSFYKEDGFIYESYPLMFLADTIHNYGNDTKNFKPTANFEYKFVCMINHGHYFRCLLIDYLEKFNLLNNNEHLISWRNNMVSTEYKFRWFQQRKITVDYPIDYNGHISAYKLIPQYHDCFLDAGSESSSNSFFITEKTIKPILWLKPFVIHGCCNFNKFLKHDMGFELFEEFIDYSFDDEDDLELRTRMYVEQIKRISEIKIEDLNSLYKKIYPKLEYNRQHAFDLMNDRSFDPKIIVEWKKHRVNGREGDKNLTVPGSHRQNQWYYITDIFGIGR